MTNWKVIYKTLKDAGIQPYAVGQHRGKCEVPYVVIREGTQLPQIGHRVVGVQKIEIILMVPYRQYTKLEPLRDKVVKALDDIKWLRRTGFETVSTTDDDREATTKSIEYQINKKIGGC